MSADPPYPQMGPHAYSLPVTSVEPGCTCRGMAACPPCQERDARMADLVAASRDYEDADLDPDLPRLLAEARRAHPDAGGWDYVPWNGVHEFRPWTVMHRPDGSRWIAPGCSCSTIRSAGPSDESEASMREWFDRHLTRVTQPQQVTDA